MDDFERRLNEALFGRSRSKALIGGTPEESHLVSWVCPYCGRRNEGKHSRCQSSYAGDMNPSIRCRGRRSDVIKKNMPAPQPVGAA